MPVLERAPEAWQTSTPMHGRQRRLHAAFCVSTLLQGRVLGPLIVAAGLLLPNPTLLLLGVATAATGCLRSWFPRDLALPLAALGLLLVGTALGLTAGLAEVDILQRSRHMVTFWVVLTGALLLRPRLPPRPTTGETADWRVAQLPAVVVTVVALIQAFDVNRVAGWMFLGTDFTEHAVMMAGVQEAGELDYRGMPYPRALHTLLALATVPERPPSGSAALLAYDLQLMGAATWLALALVLSMLASLVLRVAPALGLSARTAVIVAVVTSAASLFQAPLMLVLVPMAAAPGILAVCLLWIVPLAALALPQGRARYLVSMAVAVLATAALANTWQALLPAPGVAWLAMHSSRQGRQEAALSWHWLLGAARARFASIVLVALSAAVAAAPLVALLRGAGFAQAAADAELPAPSPWLLGLGLATVVVLAHREAQARTLAGTVVGLTAIVCVLLFSAGGGFDLSQYYPRKAMWFLLVVLLPMAGVGAGCAAVRGWGVLMRLLERLPRSVGAARVVVIAGLIAAGVAFVLPQFAVAGTLLTRALNAAEATDARKLSIALEQGDKYAPAVTVPVALGLQPLPDRYDTYVISKLLRLKTGQPQTFGLPAHACDAVREVARGAPAVVITDLDAALMSRVLAHQGCPGQRVVQISGGDVGGTALTEAQLLEVLSNVGR